MFVSFFFIFSVSDYKNCSCRVSINGSLEIKDGVDPSWDAYAVYDWRINETGWYQLHVIGNEQSNVHNMMRCAGAVEGYISWEDIFHHFNLICDMKSFPRLSAGGGDDRYPAGWKEFMHQNYRYMNQSVRAYPESYYWRTTGYIMEQFNGLVEGYNMAASPDAQMSLMDHWVLQSQGDLGDASHAIGKTTQGPTGPTAKSAMDMTSGDPESLGDHCTGLLKLTDDYSDIFVSHDAWSDYRDLHGALKEYYLPVSEFKAHRISMSTRAGKLSSYDDFYLADNGLMVIETTMSVFNESLYDYVNPKNIFTWFRAIHTMWTADNGKDWTETFIKHNSGTYNNQYLVVDTKKFKRFEKPTKDLVWVIEQYAGPFHKSEDMTEQFVRDGYIPSINKPHFKELYNIAGYPEKVAASGATGNFYTYETNARYLLIEREAPRIKTFDDFKQFMRYNNWKRDPYSNGDASQMIMSRYDQRRDFDPYGAAKAFGGLDTKAMRYTDVVTTMKFDAIASPTTTNGNPIWEFDGKFKMEYDGLPKTWNFSWMTFRSLEFNVCANLKEKECSRHDLCGWCTFDQSCKPGDKSGPFEGKCEAGWTVYSPLPSWAVPTIAAISVIVVLFVGVVFLCHLVNRKKTQ